MQLPSQLPFASLALPKRPGKHNRGPNTDSTRASVPPGCSSLCLSESHACVRDGLVAESNGCPMRPQHVFSGVQVRIVRDTLRTVSPCTALTHIHSQDLSAAWALPLHFAPRRGGLILPQTPFTLPGDLVHAHFEFVPPPSLAPHSIIIDHFEPDTDWPDLLLCSSDIQRYHDTGIFFPYLPWFTLMHVVPVTHPNTLEFKHTYMWGLATRS